MYRSLKENLKYLKKEFGGSVDLIIRNIALISPKSTNLAVITIEGMCDKQNLCVSVINPIVNEAYSQNTGKEIFEFIRDSIITAPDIVDVRTFDEMINLAMSGFAILMVDGYENMLAIGVQGFNFRSVSEPASETVQRGSREGFVEPMQINMSMIRRRIKDPDLTFETLTVGKLSKTQICLCYLKSVVSDSMLDILRKRLESIKLSTVLASGYLVSFMEDENQKSLFTGIGVSERPDTVCGKLTEGRVAVIVDGSPAVLLVPYLFIENFQAIEDYSYRSYFASFTRMLKYLSFAISLYLPALYVTLSYHNPEYFPYELLKNIMKSIWETPLPLVFEVMLIYFIYEIMREAGLKIPRPSGHVVGIVGALVIGDAAVSAGIIGAPTLMVVAISSICGYVIPNLQSSLTVLRLMLVASGALFGIFGITILSIIIIINMCSKTSIGVPYMMPITPFDRFSMRDVFIRADWKVMGKKVFKIKGSVQDEQ